LVRRFTVLQTTVAVVAVAGLAVAFPSFALALPPPTLYVAGNGGLDAGAAADTGNCQSESTPCATLAYALTHASSGATIEISGTLSEGSSTSVAQDVTLADNPDGSGATIQGSGDSDGLLTLGASSVTLRGLTLEDGYSNSYGDGGAITIQDGANLTIIESTLSDNTAADDGGAIDNGDNGIPGSVTIIDSTLSGNQANSDGGAIDNADWGTSGGSVTISGSTLSGNVAGNDGGAIDNTDQYGSNGSVTISDSTIFGNQANSDGGAIDNNDNNGTAGTVTITDSTLGGDSAIFDGQEIDTNDYAGSGGGVFLAGNVIVGVCDDNNAAGASAITDGGYNAVVDGSCLGSSPASTDAISADSGDLGSLAINGGATQTIVPAGANPALGLIPNGTSITTGPGNSVTVTCPLTDQRGFPSAAGQACDAGAVQRTQQITYASGTGGDNAGSANDGNNCSNASTPCATVQGALDQVAPGGTVELSGTFSQSEAINVDEDVTFETSPGDGNAATIDGNAQDTSGLIDVIYTGGTVAVDGLTLENGYNTASYGGGAITHNVGGQLTVSNSTLSDNTGENGGAIDNNDATSGAGLTITDSTLTGNSAPDGGAIDNSDNGANGGPVTITDSTFYDNYGADGGAIDNDDNNGSGGSVTITESTLAGDTAFQLGPEIGNSHYDTGGTVYVGADVFAGSCTNDSSATGSWTDAGYNAATDASCLGSSPAGTDATIGSQAGDLGAFANNGGATETLALAIDNPAIGLVPHGTTIATGPGNSTAVSCPVTADQRGIASASEAACDAGAVQYIEQALTFGSGIPSSAVVGQPGAAVTASSTSGVLPDFSVDATTTHGACTLSGGSVAFTHAGSCVIDASQSGNQNVAPASTVSKTITVDPASTSTSLSNSTSTLTATVSPIAPGGGTPFGTVEFQMGSQVLGTASLNARTATLAYTAPTNSSEQITASYVGSDDYTASSSTALTVDGPTLTVDGPTPTVDGPTVSEAKPSISVKLSSSTPRSRSGWWTQPVKVTFTCHANGATIRSCPRWFTIKTSGKGMQADGKVTTTAGQSAKVVIRGINIDLTKPRVSIGGQHQRRTYLLRAPAGHCRATDAVSGIRSCKLSEHTASVSGGYVSHYTARAVSNAGTATTRRASVRVSDIALIGSRSQGNKSYAVRPGHSYVLEVLSKTKPIYLNAAPSPLGPTPPHEYFSTTERIDGTPLWTVRIRITAGFSRFPAWTIGVRTSSRTTLLRLLT
jgi:hypothetical protein